MGVYIFVVVCIGLLAFAIWGVSKAADHDYMFLGAICIGLTVAMAIISIASVINAVDYTGYLLNTEARTEAQVEKRAVYVTMLSEVGALMEQDVTASDTYFEIYDKIVNFNQSVRSYERWGGTWAEGILCDPTYKNLEIIPLN